MSELEQLVRETYTALAAGDRATMERLLAPDFDASFAEGMPLGCGGPHRGAAAAIDDGWWAIGRSFAVRAEPEEWIETGDGRLLVLGTYRGRARGTGRRFTATFAHLWSAREHKLTGVVQVTDTARWHEALSADSGTPASA